MIGKFATMIPFIIVMAFTTWRFYDGTYDGMGWLDITLSLLPICLFVVGSLLLSNNLSILEAMTRTVFYVYCFYAWMYTVSFVGYNTFLMNSLLPAEHQVVPTYNLIPLDTIISVSSWNNYVHIALLIPLGILLPLIYPQLMSIKKFALIAIFIPLGLESFQWAMSYASGLFSLAPYARSFDVDTLILNSIGAMIGFALCRWLCLRMYKNLTKALADFQINRTLMQLD